jgi:hypothetical protein
VPRTARLARPAAVACAAGGALLLAACAPTTTTLPYAPSDGARVDLTDETRGVNLLVVSEGDGAEGNLLGALANQTFEDVTFTLEADGAAPVSVDVPARSTVYLGTQDGEQVLLDAVAARPGDDLEATLSAGETTKDFFLPVFDGTLPEYADFLP